MNNGVPMEFDKRLGILREGNVISPEAEAMVRRFISRLEAGWQISLTEENGGCIITHLAMALMRISRGEIIPNPETDALEEFRELDVFSLSTEIMEDLITWTPMDLPKAEKDYLVINLCLILDKGNDD
jgi:transcriptional regulatory protein LevR